MIGLLSGGRPSASTAFSTFSTRSSGPPKRPITLQRRMDRREPFPDFGRSYGLHVPGTSADRRANRADGAILNLVKIGGDHAGDDREWRQRFRSQFLAPSRYGLHTYWGLVRSRSCHFGKIILGSWASDVSAISSFPALRAPDGLKAPVTIDEILDAICALDEGPHNPSAGRPMRLRSTERSAAV